MSTKTTVLNAWQERASELGKFVWKNMAIKRDRYGVYSSNGSARWSNDGCELYAAGHIAAIHFSGKETIGLGTTSQDDECLWVALDLDNHGSDELTESNLKFACVVRERLREIGMEPIIEHSDGKGGVHLWVLFSEPIPAAVAFTFCRWMSREHTSHVLKVENFPKQRSVKSSDKSCGNYLRLFGKHHKRKYWSVFYGESSWLSIEESVELILSARLNSPALIPDEAKRDDLQVMRSVASSEKIRRARAYVKTMPGSIEGDDGSKKAFNVARELTRGFALTTDEALPVMQEWNAKCTPVWSDGELIHKLESAADSPGEVGYRLRTAESAATGTEKIRTFEREDRTDIANADHFVLRNSNRLKFCHSWKKWIAWDGCRWRVSDDGTPLRLVKALCEEIFQLAMKSQIEEAVSFAASTARLQRLQAILTLAAAEMPVAVEDLDQNEWLLNCPNGTIDLRTGELREHRREDNITKLCPTEFHPDAEAPTWLRFLHSVFDGDELLIGFIQRLFGYIVTGSVREQKLPIFWGSGSNGKSTLLKAIIETLGHDYAMTGQSDILVERRGDSHPTELTDLFGRRLVVVAETDSHHKLAEGTVKSLTGGEAIRARRMREDFWEFNPSHKLILCTNHKPVVRGTDHAIWRRMLLVPFAVKFEGSAVDPTLSERLKAERSGILAWCIAGCRQWLETGLSTPLSVQNATNEYQSSEDIIGRFISACCFVNFSGSVVFKHLYKRMESWCEDTGDFCPSKRAVGSWLKEHGFKDTHSGGRGYEGLTLLPE